MDAVVPCRRRDLRNTEGCGAEKFLRLFTQYHEDIADGIIHLFSAEKGDYSFRVKYYSALNRLYTHNFYERLYRWCDEHGCMLTGHSVEETLLSTQMLGCAGLFALLCLRTHSRD